MLRFRHTRDLFKAASAACVTLFFVTGCVSQPANPGLPQPSATPAYPDSLHWFRDSAEQKAIYLETYWEATQAARKLSASLAAGSWGVILDIDETILDNSEYQKRLAVSGTTYDTKTWDAWVQEAAATALPGAKMFIDTVTDELHGRVVLVTNRTKAQCDVTERNLRQVSIRYEQIACDTTDPGDRRHGDKNERFQQIADGALNFSKMRVLIFIGDNIQDFPHLSQASPGDPADFGVRYFVLPNPMYGSWVGNPRR